MKLNESIKHYRTEANMSQSELAKKTYTTKSTISKWEGGTITPNIDMIKIIAQALDIKFYQLLGEKQPIGNLIINTIGKVFLYLFIWIHIDITVGFTITAVAGVLGLLGIVAGLGGGVTLGILFHIHGSLNGIRIFYIITLVVSSPLILIVFGFTSYVLYEVSTLIYNFSFKYFWRTKFRLKNIKISSNKKLWIGFGIASLIALIVLITFLSIVGANNQWTLLNFTTH